MFSVACAVFARSGSNRLHHALRGAPRQNIREISRFGIGMVASHPLKQENAKLWCGHVGGWAAGVRAGRSTTDFTAYMDGDGNQRRSDSAAAAARRAGISVTSVTSVVHSAFMAGRQPE